MRHSESNALPKERVDANYPELLYMNECRRLVLVPALNGFITSTPAMGRKIAFSKFRGCSLDRRNHIGHGFSNFQVFHTLRQRQPMRFGSVHGESSTSWFRHGNTKADRIQSDCPRVVSPGRWGNGLREWPAGVSKAGDNSAHLRFLLTKFSQFVGCV